MDYICPHCDTELELVEIETYQPFGGSSNEFKFSVAMKSIIPIAMKLI